MKTIHTKLTSISQYSQSKHHSTPKNPGESHQDYEARTWRERLHADEEGRIFMPPMGFKNCLSEAAKFLGIKIPGKRNSTFTKHFEAGVLVMDPVRLEIKKDEVQGEWLFVPSDGRRGGGSRVEKCFGVIPEWCGTVVWHVLDETVLQTIEVGGENKTAFEHHLDQAGKFIGIGRFRPRNNGYYGRFKISELSILPEQ